MGVARALIVADPGSAQSLKKAGLLARGPRMKERKKPGRPGARQALPVLQALIGPLDFADTISKRRGKPLTLFCCPNASWTRRAGKRTPLPGRSFRALNLRGWRQLHLTRRVGEAWCKSQEGVTVFTPATRSTFSRSCRGLPLRAQRGGSPRSVFEVASIRLVRHHRAADELVQATAQSDRLGCGCSAPGKSGGCPPRASPGQAGSASPASADENTFVVRLGVTIWESRCVSAGKCSATRGGPACRKASPFK